MKVAIIGAGLAGLSCAHALENLKIDFNIFEKNLKHNYLEYSICTLKLQNLFRKDLIKHVKKSMDLKLKPLNELHTIEMYSQNSSFQICGNLGYIFPRGRFHKNTLEQQIICQLKTPIDYNSYMEMDHIKDEYDYIVVATGTSKIPKKYNLWTNTFSAYTRIGKVVGNCRTDLIKMWFDKDFCKNGFVYLIPNNDKECFVMLIVDNISHEELDFYWKKFLDAIPLNGILVSTFDLYQNTGFMSDLIHENMIFIGNSSGFCDNFLGFGTMAAIHSGYAAAQHIGNNLDYKEEMEPQMKYIKNMNYYRKAIDNMDNKDLDLLISTLDKPLLKRLIYKNPFFHMDTMAPLLKKFSKK
ncbi:FAD-dependent oxidoreductase [Anaeromicrobium sp.]|uniref:FAD-dependent oxidoreductase n=1 Tax=Anaeromicrobium sp. TaxID=1929132 RepID=UPI0025FE612E|nr:FAD-dependent oxidoreductase [Anaeromicrobium sp.]